MDLRSGCWQLPITGKQEQKTAFKTHSEFLQFTDMFNNLANAPPFFQKIMTRILHGLAIEIWLIYLDDIIVFSSTFTAPSDIFSRKIKLSKLENAAD